MYKLGDGKPILSCQLIERCCISKIKDNLDNNYAFGGALTVAKA